MINNFFQKSFWPKTLIVFFTISFILILGVLHFLDKNVIFDKSFISDFALGSFNWLFVLSLSLLSIAKVMLAQLVKTLLKPSRLSSAIQFFILFSALTNILIGVFPTQNGPDVNIIGVLHIVFATLSFASTAVFLAMFIFLQRSSKTEMFLRVSSYLPYILTLLMYSFLGADLKPLAERFLTLFIVIGIVLNTVLLKDLQYQFNLPKISE